jgi:hypothetical protein
MVAVACTSNANRPLPDVQKRSEAPPVDEKPQHPTFSVPRSATPGDRLRKLWAESRPFIQNDAQANLSGSQYLLRREPLFKAWIELQSDLAKPESIAAERATSEVILLIDEVYGYPGYSEAVRKTHRQNIDLHKTLAELDETMNALH